MNFLRCPLCHSPLQDSLAGVVCANGHQFDRAREGYLNLLPVQHKHSRDPGDAKQQLQARQQFLQRGYFDVLWQTLLNLLPKSDGRLLDLGCGEGYFSLAIQEQRPELRVQGMDIAKEGVRLAAKKAKQQGLATQFCVASNYSLPFMDASLDVVTRIFAPSKDEELQRVLAQNGCLLIVTPGERHLLGLRQKLYTDVRPHPAMPSPGGFACVASHELNQRLTVAAGDDTRALLTMTPFAWRLRDELLDPLVESGLDDELDFKFHLFTHK